MSRASEVICTTCQARRDEGRDGVHQGGGEALLGGRCRDRKAGQPGVDEAVIGAAADPEVLDGHQAGLDGVGGRVTPLATSASVAATSTAGGSNRPAMLVLYSMRRWGMAQPLRATAR